MSFDLDHFYSELYERNILLAYKGSITSELIDYALEAIEIKLNETNEDGKLKRRIYNVMVESLQNLYHHLDNPPENRGYGFDPNFGILVVSKEGKEYVITTTNFILTTKIKFLKDRIDKINSLTEEELKEMYKFILNHQRLTSKGGGGLGFVDIARKTGNKMQYIFNEFNGDYYLFTLNISVS